MTEYIVKVGKKGELYLPKKLRIKINLHPGSEFLAVTKGDDIVFRKRKTIIDLLRDKAVAVVSQEEIKKDRRVLEKELLER